jgi:hypothetical protein
MDNSTKGCENRRANRISLRTCESHDSVTIIYESLCDRDYAKAKIEIKRVISEMKQLLNCIDEDDF